MQKAFFFTIWKKVTFAFHEKKKKTYRYWHIRNGGGWFLVNVILTSILWLFASWAATRKEDCFVTFQLVRLAIESSRGIVPCSSLDNMKQHHCFYALLKFFFKNWFKLVKTWTSLVAQMVKASAYNAEDPWVQSLGWEDPLEKEMATHSGTLAWKIQWTGEPGGLQSMGSQESDTIEQLQ